MTRPGWIIACLIIVGIAAMVNGLKLRGHSEAEQAAELRDEIRDIKAEIELLQAEWFRLNHPARLQKLAEADLALGAPKPRQIYPLENGGYAQALISLELVQSATAGIDETGRPFIVLDKSFAARPQPRSRRVEKPVRPVPSAFPAPSLPEEVFGGQ